MDEKIRERTRNPEVQANRRANQTVAPFLAKLGQWNLQAASWAARESSPATTEAEREDLRRRRLQAVIEIESEFQLFKAAVIEETGQARIADVNAAFQRLLRTINY
jgi:PAS domain-containing protein